MCPGKKEQEGKLHPTTMGTGMLRVRASSCPGPKELVGLPTTSAQLSWSAAVPRCLRAGPAAHELPEHCLPSDPPASWGLHPSQGFQAAFILLHPITALFCPCQSPWMLALLFCSPGFSQSGSRAGCMFPTRTFPLGLRLPGLLGPPHWSIKPPTLLLLVVRSPLLGDTQHEAG